jgi:hypothetical protein
MARSTTVKRDRMLWSEASLSQRPLFEQTGVTDFVVVNAVAAAGRVVDAREKKTPVTWRLECPRLTCAQYPNQSVSLVGVKRTLTRLAGLPIAGRNE